MNKHVHLLQLTLAPSFNICDTPGALGTCNAMFIIKTLSFDVLLQLNAVSCKLCTNIMELKTAATNNVQIVSSDTTVAITLSTADITDNTNQVVIYDTNIGRYSGLKCLNPESRYHPTGCTGNKWRKKPNTDY
jgi:hypothetical protein